MINEFLDRVATLGRPRDRQRALGLALKASDLPGEGWRRTGQLVNRFVLPQNRKDRLAGNRAHRGHGLTVARYFTQTHMKRYVEHRVAEYASASDARIAVARAPDLLVKNPRSSAEVIARRTLTDIVVPRVDACWVSEQDLNADFGLGSLRRIIASHGMVYFAVTCAGPDHLWSWEDVVALCERQVEKIQSTRTGPQGPGGNGEVGIEE